LECIKTGELDAFRDVLAALHIHSSGLILRGGFMAWASTQARFSSASLSPRHSSTRLLARGGKRPPSTLPEFISMMALWSPQVAWKCGGAWSA